MKQRAIALALRALSVHRCALSGCIRSAHLFIAAPYRAAFAPLISSSLRPIGLAFAPLISSSLRPIGLAFAPLISSSLRPIGLAFAPLISSSLRPIGLAFAPLISSSLRPIGLAFAPLMPQIISARGGCRLPKHRSQLWCCKTRATLLSSQARQIDPSPAARNGGRCERQFHRDRSE